MDEEHTRKLACFIQQWTAIQQHSDEPLENKLALFFQKWVSETTELVDVAKPETIQHDINHLALSHFFNTYQHARRPMLEAMKQGMSVNVWQTAGLKHDEVRNSKVLQWFLNPNGNHGQADALLKQFITLLPIEFQNLDTQNSRVIAESCPLGENTERVDIEIDAQHFLLFIEIKINAYEGQEQLNRYLSIAQRKAQNRPWLVVYLTNQSQLPVMHRNKQNLIAISWQQVAKVFLQYSKQAETHNRSAWLAQQFAEHIQAF